MAETDEGQERTEDPTARRLQKALDEGEVLSSRDLLLTVVMLGGALQLSIGGRYYFQEFLTAFRTGMDFSDALKRDVPLINVVGERLADIALPVAAFTIPLVVLLFIAQTAIGGIHFLPQNAMFKTSRISFINGLSKIFGTNSLIELGKSLLKIILVGSVGVIYLYSRLPEIMMLGDVPFEAAMTDAGSIVAMTLIVLVFATAIVAAVDVFYQWNRRQARLKMTKQEVKDEMKETDGSPEVKRRIRQLQREAADRGSVANISQAQVIITNPSHFAIGLRYDFEKGTAPKVVVKGTDSVAKSIREKAAEQKLPVLSYPLLARALYFTTEIGAEIHAELYRAVATVLSFVFHAGAEGEPPEIEVPEALRFDANGRSMERKNG
jgi:flagellar biosynthesis protein FlhB